MHRQIARHFGLPFRGGGGLNSSQVPDAQAAYESLMTMLPTFLAGTNFVMHSAGWLEGGLVSCFEKYVIDVQVLEMLQKEFTPLEIDEARSRSTLTLRWARRSLPRRDAHHGAVPHLLLPAVVVVVGELRALDPTGAKDTATRAGEIANKLDE